MILPPRPTGVEEARLAAWESGSWYLSSRHTVTDTGNNKDTTQRGGFISMPRLPALCQCPIVMDVWQSVNGHLKRSPEVTVAPLAPHGGGSTYCIGKDFRFNV